MCATIEKFLIRASVITTQFSTPDGSGPASGVKPRAVGDDRSRFEHHVGADLGVGADAGVSGDDTVGEARALADVNVFPEDGILYAGAGADSATGAEHDAWAHPGVAADLDVVSDDRRRHDAILGAPDSGRQPRPVVALTGRGERRAHAPVEQVHLGRSIGARAADV